MIQRLRAAGGRLPLAHPVSFVSIVPFVLFVLIAVLGPAVLGWCGIDAMHADMTAALQSPGREHWFGTDTIGRDIFARVVVAARLDLFIGVASVALAAIAGSVIGGGAAWFGGGIDRIVQRTADVAMAFPLFVVALTVAAVLGNGPGSVIVATGVINLPFFARLARAEVAQRRGMPYVAAARLAGWRAPRILWAALLPNSLPSLVSHAATNIGWAMLNGAGLSFVGLGIRPPAAEWGVMIADGSSAFIGGQWWLVVFPALALFLAVLAVTHAGEWLRDCFDPRRSASAGTSAATGTTHAASQSKPPGSFRSSDSTDSGVSTDSTVLYRASGLTLTAADGVTRLVDDVSFTLHAGEATALVGASGSGKTLTALAIAGLLPDSVQVSGGPIGLTAGQEKTAVLRTAFVFQEARAALNPVRRIGAQLDDVLRTVHSARSDSGKALSKAQRRACAVALLREVGMLADGVIATGGDPLASVGVQAGLAGQVDQATQAAQEAHEAQAAQPFAGDSERAARSWLRRYPHQLSGGQCQRVLIALALARQPTLLIADEPTTGLDPANTERILALLREVARRRGMSLLLITHDLDTALSHCERVLVMRRGRLVETVPANGFAFAARTRYARLLYAMRDASRVLPETHLRVANADSAARITAAEKMAEGDGEITATATATDTRHPAAALLTVSALSKRYGGDSILRHLELAIRPGEVVGLRGRSGSGKSTLASIIARLLEHDTGSLLWRPDAATPDGTVDLAVVTVSRAARQPWRHALQYVFQDAKASLDPLRDVSAALQMNAISPGPAGAHGISPPTGSEPFSALLRSVRLPRRLLSCLPHQLSGGEAARVALARALAGNPRLLILDEPTAALDPLTRARVLRTLLRVARRDGIAVLFVSHDTPVLKAICDRVLTLADGVLVS